MRKKKTGVSKETEKATEDLDVMEDMTNKLLNRSDKIIATMNKLEGKVNNFNEKYEQFFAEMPIMTEMVRQRLEKYRSVTTTPMATAEEINESLYYVPFWEGYLSALLWVTEVLKNMDSEVTENVNSGSGC